MSKKNPGEPKMTSFSMDDEYEGGFFANDGEFYYKNAKKKQKKLSKEDQIYGIFKGSSESGDENEGNKYDSFVPEDSKEMKRLEKDTFSKFAGDPMMQSYFSFVKSGSLQQPISRKVQVHHAPNAGTKKVTFADEKVDLINDLDDLEGQEEEEEELQNIDKDILRRKRIYEMKLKKPDLSAYDLPVAFGTKSKPKVREETITASKKAAKEQEEHEDYYLDPATHQYKANFGKGFEIMSKIGFKLGQGLGRDNQGIVKPVEAVKKTQFDPFADTYGGAKGGLGFSKEDKKAKGKPSVTTTKRKRGALDDLMGDLLEDEDLQMEKEKDIEALAQEEDLEELKERKVFAPSRKWMKKKKNKATAQEMRVKKPIIRPDELLKSMEENKILLKSQEPAGQPGLLQHKVLDLTGKEVRHATDYSFISAWAKDKLPTALSSSIGVVEPQKKPRFLEEFALFFKRHYDRLKHNLFSLERKIKSEDDRLVAYSYEVKQLTEELRNEDESIKNMHLIANTITKVKELINKKEDIDLFAVFSDLADKASKDYHEYNLSTVFTAMMVRQQKAQFTEWKPLEKPTRSFELFIRLMEFYKTHEEAGEGETEQQSTSNKKAAFSLITARKTQQKSKLIGVTNHMLYVSQELWLPPVRTTIVNAWDPKNECDKCADLIELWAKVIPKTVINHVIDHFIMPKLLQAIDSWNPTEDKMLIHQWVHPWLPIIKFDRLKTLWKPIQTKLTSSLQNWKPTDRSALVVLAPWHKVLEKNEWNLLIMRCIMPKLMYSLQSFEVNPRNQRLDELRALFPWIKYMDIEQVVLLIENPVMQKLLNALNQWLKNPSAQYSELQSWYEGWTSFFPRELAEHPTIVSYFNKLADKITAFRKMQEGQRSQQDNDKGQGQFKGQEDDSEDSFSSSDEEQMKEQK